jgi:hypothetical protein
MVPPWHSPKKKKTGIARQSHVGCSCHGLPGPVRVPRCRVLKRSKQASKQRAYHHHHYTALHCTITTPTLPKRPKVVINVPLSKH